MSKPWEETGLSDFRSWLGDTEPRRGLVYRGDADFEQLGPGGWIVLLEFKRCGEGGVSRGQLNWLKHRAQQPRTAVAVVRELSDDWDDPNRPVHVWGISPVHTLKGLRLGGTTLDVVAEWVDSKAYRAKP